MSKSFGDWIKNRVLSEAGVANFDLNDYIERRAEIKSGRKTTPLIFCKSGLKLSVQAGADRYSSPMNDMGPYRGVEIGYTSKKVPEFLPYIENPDDDPMNAVYSNVPVKVVEDIVDKNGGLIEEEQ
jgi:hypothetical protein